MRTVLEFILFPVLYQVDPVYYFAVRVVGVCSCGAIDFASKYIRMHVAWYDRDAWCEAMLLLEPNLSFACGLSSTLCARRRCLVAHHRSLHPFRITYVSGNKMVRICAEYCL